MPIFHKPQDNGFTVKLSPLDHVKDKATAMKQCKSLIRTHHDFHSTSILFYVGLGDWLPTLGCC